MIRVMTDNDPLCKAFTFRDACKHIGLRHIRTKTITPSTNGKAERVNKTIITERAYARAYSSSDQCTADLPKWAVIGRGDSNVSFSPKQQLEHQKIMFIMTKMDDSWNTWATATNHRIPTQNWLPSPVGRHPHY